MNEKLGATLALVNACLNGSSALLLFGGWVAIKSRRRRLHGWLMASAFTVSILFLVSYLTRVMISGTHRYPGSGAWKTIYLALLMSHMLLAVVTPPLAIRTIWLAYKRRFADHKRIVSWTLPIWMYVSVTGVLVYVMLYHPPG
jgi:putative membrane protein